MIAPFLRRANQTGLGSAASSSRLGFVQVTASSSRSGVVIGTVQRRTYATTSEPPSASGSSTQQTKQQWKPKQPLATAQTLTLFSETPQGLLIALRSTLQGMMSLASRLGPSPSSNPSSASERSHDHVLLYSLSKDLPSQYLSEAVSLLRGPESSSGKQNKSEEPKTAAEKALAETEASQQPQDGPRIARVGILSSPLPSSLIPSNAMEPNSAPISTPTLHSVSLSFLPGTNAIPFRSTIPGKADVSVGRWVNSKSSWNQGSERRADLLDDGNGALPNGARDWREIWGRENLEGKIPESLEKLDASTTASFLIFSDTSPHGLLEGLASRFPRSSVLGLTAPPTPFETGRDQTLLLSLPDSEQNGVHESGAVGVALVASPEAVKEATPITIPRVITTFEGLKPFGERREISAAQGNIISALNGSNAAQQFLRDIQSRGHPLDAPTQSSSGSSKDVNTEAQSMSEAQARQIASKVKKEEDFFIGIYAEKGSSEGEGEPLLLAQILSGHPSRGTLSIDTDADLGPGPGNQQGTMKTYAQFYQIDPSFATSSKQGGHSLTGLTKLLSPSSIEIPGPDPRVWVTPRFLFLSLSPLETSSQSSSSALDQGKESAKMKHSVMALPNLFIAASDRGWIAGKGRSSHPNPGNSDDAVSTTSTLQKDGSTIVACTVPLARAMLSLRGEE